ncbi:MAG: hypothetical protein PHU80_05835, partial [Kiritimatiellae bacterium]|nr:hypothetical protein [Kiritimatiellia bacterium]
MKPQTARLACAAFLCLFFSAVRSYASVIYKADNDLPLNDPLSWEGASLPGATDIAVFDERVTANRLNFQLTGDLSVQGLLATNTAAGQPVSSATLNIGTNGTDTATLTIGNSGVRLSNSGLALTFNLPLALSDSQIWDAASNMLSFSDTVNGTADWTMAGTSGIYWNVASGYNGNLAIPNAAAPSICRFSQAGQIAKSFSLSGPSTAIRIEMSFPGTVDWSTLFADRSAYVTNPLVTVANGATLNFADSDLFSFPGGRFVLDNGNASQTGGTLSGRELQIGYQDFNCLYTLGGGSISLDYYLVLGNKINSLSASQIFRQNGGTVTTPIVGIGHAAFSYQGVSTYEMNNGILYACK